MLVPPSGEFSADRIIELALRQDTGPDGSMSMLKQRIKLMDDGSQGPIHEYKKKYRDNDPTLGPDYHFAGANYIEK